MKRKPITHGGIFEDRAFAQEYARKHWKMAAGFGRDYGKVLRKEGFVRGRVLDVGCGFGATNLTLAEQFPDSRFVGIDLSDPLLHIARRTVEERGLSAGLRFEKADVLDMPFEDDSFDVLLNLNMAHLVHDPIRMFSEMERVLRPNGFLFVADLRRSVMGIIEREIRSALSCPEARELIRASPLRAGTFSCGLIWWRYERMGQI